MAIGSALPIPLVFLVSTSAAGGDADAQSFAAAATAMRSSHIGRGPGLIDEDKALGIEIGCASNQASRRFRMSGRSCSVACAVFFCA
jgi:hypothetical protein